MERGKNLVPVVEITTKNIQWVISEYSGQTVLPEIIKSCAFVNIRTHGIATKITFATKLK